MSAPTKETEVDPNIWKDVEGTLVEANLALNRQDYSEAQKYFSIAGSLTKQHADVLQVDKAESVAVRILDGATVLRSLIHPERRLETLQSALEVSRLAKDLVLSGKIRREMGRLYGDLACLRDQGSGRSWQAVFKAEDEYDLSNVVMSEAFEQGALTTEALMNEQTITACEGYLLKFERTHSSNTIRRLELRASINEMRRKLTDPFYRVEASILLLRTLHTEDRRLFAKEVLRLLEGYGFANQRRIAEVRLAARGNKVYRRKTLVRK